MGTKGCQNECVLFPRRKPAGIVGHYQWHFWQSAHGWPYGSVFLPSTYASIAFWHCMCSPIRDTKHECQMAENKSWGCPTLPQNLPAHLPLLMLPNLTPNPSVIHRWFNQSCSDRSCDWTSTRNGRHCEKVATIPSSPSRLPGPSTFNQHKVSYAQERTWDKNNEFHSCFSSTMLRRCHLTKIAVIETIGETSLLQRHNWACKVSQVHG